MGVQLEIPEKSYVMRDFHSSPVARAFRFVVRLSVPMLCLGAILYIGVPTSGPDTPVRTIPDYTRIAGLATLVSAPETRMGEFTQYVSWVAPPRFNWDYFAGMDDSAGPDSTADEASTEGDQSTISDLARPAMETAPVAFFVPDSFGGSGWDLSTPDTNFILSARPGFGSVPEPGTALLFVAGIAGLAFGALYRRRRQSDTRVNSL
jgi:hypothetical protein